MQMRTQDRMICNIWRNAGMFPQGEAPQQGGEGRKDARKTPRRRMLTAARIVFNNKSSVYDCTVRDLSEGGARLILPNLLGVPKSFELWIDKFNSKYVCDTVWRNKGQMGVKFDTPPV